jgi:hypothetical protein
MVDSTAAGAARCASTGGRYVLDDLARCSIGKRPAGQQLRPAVDPYGGHNTGFAVPETAKAMRCACCRTRIGAGNRIC